jgi:hypothetical protein
MTFMSSSAVWLLTGVDAVLVVIVCGILFLYVRNKKRDTTGVADLVKTIKENEPAQLETLRTALKEQYSQKDDDAAENAKQLAKLRKGFYKHLINIHLNKHDEAFGSIDQHLDALLMAYRTLMPVTVIAEPPAEQTTDAGQISTAEGIDFQADLEEIKRQNDELKKELEETKLALESAISEYVNAYSGGAKDGKQRLEKEMHKLHERHENVDPVLPDEAIPPAAPAAAPPQAPAAAGGSTDGENQKEIDHLLEDMPNLDGILAQEVGGGDDSGDGTLVAEATETAADAPAR